MRAYGVHVARVCACVFACLHARACVCAHRVCRRARATSAVQHEVALGSPEFIKMLFSIFDNDGAGTITFDEVAAVLTKFGSWDMAEMSQLFREMDSSGGGDVDMQEFSLFVRTILEG